VSNLGGDKSANFDCSSADCKKVGSRGLRGLKHLTHQSGKCWQAAHHHFHRLLGLVPGPKTTEMGNRSGWADRWFMWHTLGRPSRANWKGPGLTATYCRVLLCFEINNFSCPQRQPHSMLMHFIAPGPGEITQKTAHKLQTGRA